MKGSWLFYLDEPFVFENKNGTPYWTIPAKTRIWIDDIRRSGKLWNRFKEMTYKRKGRFCDECGFIEYLSVHHVIPVSEDPYKMFDFDNCRVLCQHCHSDIDKGLLNNYSVSRNVRHIKEIKRNKNG